MNILDSSALRPCTSCQMCAAVCPKGAIDIRLNDEGFYRPFVLENRCIDCGLCTKVCYRFDSGISVTSDSDLERIPLYSAYAKSVDVLRNTTSGGVADILAHQLVGKGYKVIGVSYDADRNDAIAKVADSEDDILSFRGSKYIQAYTLDAFKSLVSTVRNDNYAVFGLPCQIYAVSKYLTLIGRRNNCVLVDVFCHGCPSKHLWQKISDDVKRRKGVTRFDNVVWRSKRNGWGDFVLEIVSGGRTIYHSVPMHNEFYDSFFSNSILNDSCNECEVRSTLAYSDIRLGDYWGPLYKRNVSGVSGVCPITEAGLQLFKEIESCLERKEETKGSFFPYQAWKVRYSLNKQLRHSLLDSLKDNNLGLNDAMKEIHKGRNLIGRVKPIAKQCISFLPSRVRRLFR